MATMILESPYYGARRPPWQEGSKLKRVSDLLTLGRATIEESLYLLAWAQRQQYRHLGEEELHFSVHLRMLCPPLGQQQGLAGGFLPSVLSDAHRHSASRIGCAGNGGARSI